MHPRALKRLLQLARPKRFNVIADGLDLFVEHVGTLRRDLACLAEAGRPRGGAVLAALSEEEAAKVLILLDLVRMDTQDQRAASRQIARFYNHLARCIYVEVAEMRPANFGEVRAMVYMMRQSHFLDGPTGDDWIFRNQLMARREDALYVDYVREEDGDRWTTPAAYDTTPSFYATSVQDLVLALHRLGGTSRASLDVIAQAWAGHRIGDNTHWRDISAVNRRVVEELAERNLALPEATTEDAGRVIERWPFPLGGLDVSAVEVPLSALEAERARRFPYDD